MKQIRFPVFQLGVWYEYSDIRHQNFEMLCYSAKANELLVCFLVCIPFKFKLAVYLLKTFTGFRLIRVLLSTVMSYFEIPIWPNLLAISA